METRRIVISVKYSESELERLDSMVSRTNRKRATYIRDVSLGKEIKAKPSTELYEILKELRYMNNNLNQIAIKANKYNFIDEPSLSNTIKELNKFILDVKKTYLA